MWSEAEAHSLARRILHDALGWPDAAFTLRARTHHFVYDVQAGAQRAMLRLHQRPVEAALQRGEMDWLRFLSEYGLAVPRPLVASHDAGLPPLLHDQTRVAFALFAYVEGAAVDQADLIEHQAQQIGALLAQMHLAAQAYAPSGDALRPRLDADGLFGEAGLYALDEAALALFQPQHGEIMQATAAQIAGLMRELGTGPERFGMIHADLLLKNVIFTADANQPARPVDFEYCGPGYFVSDLAPLFWQLKTDTRYLALANAVLEGYARLRPLSSVELGLIEPFIAARHLASLRWLALNRQHPALKGGAAELIAARVTELAEYLDSGILRRQTISL